ncbi:MAG: hypothetical protein IKD15_03770 [Clostridia bacterium]|nr:hypothetical protein [Clostridia bacterium]
MGRKLKKTLIVLLLAICSLFVFAGCELGETLDDALALRDLNPQVTYYANGGRFEKNNQKKKTNFYYKVGSTAYDYGKATFSGSAEIDRPNFEFMGWYFVEEVTDEENGICVLGDKVDFTVPLQEGEHWKVAAKWKALVGLNVVMACEEGVTINVTTKEEEPQSLSFTNGSKIREIEYDYTTDEVASAPVLSKYFNVDGKTHTFYMYYDDPECTQETKFPIARGEEQRTVYAKYIEGDWTYVKTASNVRTMFSDLKGGANKQYWIWNDIDCSKITVEAISKFKGEIKGNGFTLKGLSVEGSLIGKTTSFALFGQIGQTAKITDLTIKNATLTAKFSTPEFKADVYFLFASKHADATIENVNVSGTLNITGPGSCVVNNIMKESGTVYSNCLYGGYATDAEYVTESQGNEFILAGEAEDIVTIALN